MLYHLIHQGSPCACIVKSIFERFFSFVCFLQLTLNLSLSSRCVNLKLIKMFQRFYNYFLYTLITFSVIWCLKLSALTYHWIIPFYWAFRYKNIFLYQYYLHFYTLYLINSIKHYNASFVSIYFYLLQVFFLLIFFLLDILFTSLQIMSAFLYSKLVAPVIVFVTYYPYSALYVYASRSVVSNPLWTYGLNFFHVSTQHITSCKGL